jgi:hypothetical protein
MPRIATSLPVLALSLLLLPVENAVAAGFGRGVGSAPARPMAHSRPVTTAWRSAPRGQHILPGQRAARFHHHRGTRWFLGGPGFYPFDSGSESMVLREGDAAEPEREIDRDSFENMPVRLGIPRSPEPRPVIYRIEGTKARPAVRVLRVGIEDRRAGYRHLASREGGNAEILTFRRR